MDMHAFEERLLVEARFRALVSDWDLGRSQVAELLGIGTSGLGPDLVPRVATQDTEHRLRLLTEIRNLLPSILPDEREVPLWLRGAFGDADGDSPLDFMAGGVDRLRAMRAAILALACPL